MIKTFEKILFEHEDSKLFKCGLAFFYLGAFLLPSAIILSVILLLISLLISLFKFRNNILFDKWNLPFIIASILLILSTIFHINSYEITNTTLSEQSWDPKLAWVGLANWLPLFWSFWGFQPYLKNLKLRRNLSLILLSGTFPVLVSGIGQLLFQWYGPLQALNGLIVWYQRPIANLTGISGLFNNPNYAGAWLNLVWPFIIASFLQLRNKKLILINFIFAITTLLFIVFTGSRSAWGGLVLSIPIMLGKKCLKWYVPIILFISIIFLSIIYPLFGQPFQIFMQKNIHQDLWIDFTKFGFLELDVSRLEIWKVAIKTILEKPFFGHGWSSFPSLFKIETGLWKGHTHNMPLELAVSYGIPAALLIVFQVSSITFFAFRKTYAYQKRDTILNNFDKSWLTSLILIIIAHLVDVQYFDGRISLASWILLAGARNIIK